MVREARLLWDNPQLGHDDSEHLRRLDFGSGSDPEPDLEPRRRKKRPARTRSDRAAESPKPSSVPRKHAQRRGKKTP
jgi:hypothetical protein